MPDTRGFEIVAEVKRATLQALLEAAWESGGSSSPGTIPHEIALVPTTSLGPYPVVGGQVTIPQEGLSIAMAPQVDGVMLGLSTTVQVNLDPVVVPVAALQHLELQIDLAVTAPLGTVPGSTPDIGILFEDLPRERVSAELTRGHPVGEVILDMLREYVHGLYTSETIPHVLPLEDQRYFGYTFDIHLEIYDDETDPDRAIVVTQPDPTHLGASLPIYLRLSDVRGESSIDVPDPMGVVGRVVLTAEYEQTPGAVLARLSQASVSVEQLGPAPGEEGEHYEAARAAFPFLEGLLAMQITSLGQALVEGLDDFEVTIPTVDELEGLIGDEVHRVLLAQRFLGIWTPTTPEGAPVGVVEVRPRVLANALAIAVNPTEGADDARLADFVPPDRDFAIGLAGDFVEQTIREIIDRPRHEGGLAGHRVDLHGLKWELQAGRIHFWGNATAYDVFSKSDAAISFWADVGLRWTAPDTDGAQQLEAYLIDQDQDLPWWAWLLAALGQQLQVRGGWPRQLQGVGTVATVFDGNVVIDRSGLVFSGSMKLDSTFRDTLVEFADTHGPYVGNAVEPLVFAAGPADARVSHVWDFGDGAQASGHQVAHVYPDDGLYLLELTTRVLEPGGATTHHSTTVRVRNVPPVVDAGPDVMLQEGEELVLTGHFFDREWVDTHEAVWDFGDASLPVIATIDETNEPPRAQGTATARHTYCNNGTYTATLRVRDDDGGVGEDTLTVHVENVAPEVSAAAHVFAYPCVPVTLIATFVDPGWCDRHAAHWRFGDGDLVLAPTPATVQEVNEPPFAHGLAAATHTYHALGTHVAECVVLDGDGAAGRATLTVFVVDLLNEGFEAGFRSGRWGTVGNEWQPYALRDPSGVVFDAEELVVRGGQRSQRIQVARSAAGGIAQSVGANVGWDYQVVAHYHVDDRTGGTCRVGIDPAGGSDPEAAEIVWAEGTARGEWRKLSVRATAVEPRITVFLEASGPHGPGRCYFDEVELAPFPCPLPPLERPQRRAPELRRACVDFTSREHAETLGSTHVEARFVFRSQGARPLMIAMWGQPPQRSKLAFADAGVAVLLPFAAEVVLVDVSTSARKPVRLAAYDAAGDIVDLVHTVAPHGARQPLRVEGESIVRVVASGGGEAGLLHQICATGPTSTRRPVR